MPSEFLGLLASIGAPASYLTASQPLERPMSAANVSFVQSLYAFGRGDIATIIDGLTSDVDWDVNGRRKDYPLLGNWKGKAAVEQSFRGVAEHEEATEFSPREFFAAGDRVFVLGHYCWKIRKTGRTAASDWAHIFTIRCGKVAKFREFNDTAVFAEAYRG
jgi:ketosteroid isomerase-like protein